MFRVILLVYWGLLIGNISYGQELPYYLPQSATYDPDIPTPASVLGHEVGEWHVSHDKLVRYMETLAEVSDRITIETYGHTYEKRPLLLLTVTDPDNHSNLENIRKQHHLLSDPSESANLDISNMPVVVWMGYSVHGNEASGTNASLLAAYYLAAAQSTDIDNMLMNTVILIDPSINPDGMNRFASWVNSHRGKNPDGNAASLEHNEAWPGGRTNHYWFDLNRDWLPLQHPESKGRVAKFHYWKPNVLTDHHEMRSHRTFFFQPGVPSRTHPLSPESTQILTKEIAKYHATALDKIGSLYYTEESYDDFYYGKGSTYPDVNGAIGILFEQASVRGHVRDTEYGVRSFPFAIRNQFTTTLSTLKASQELRMKLLEHHRNFYQTAIGEADNDNIKGYIFSSNDQGRMYHFLDMIGRHQIEVFNANENIKVDGKSYDTNNSYVVPLRQNQYRLVKAIFEKRTQFQDSLFYDVSGWTLPLAFNLDYSPLEGRSFQNSILGNRVDQQSFPEGQVVGGSSQYGYVLECTEYYSYRAINKLFKKGLRMQVASEVMTLESGISLRPGTVLIQVGRQKLAEEEIYKLLQQITKEDGVTVRALATGFSTQGKSWGSPTMKPINQPRVLVMAGDDVDRYEAGEVWHLLDQRFDIDMSLVSQKRFHGLNLSKFNILVMVSGQYLTLSKKAKEKLKLWIEGGGLVISWKTGAKWLSGLGIGSISFEKTLPDTTSQLPYGTREKYAGAREIGGAIFQVRLDLTHPLAYGIDNPNLPVFRDSDLFMKKSNNPFTNPGLYTSNPVLSGYIHSKKLEELKNSPAITVSHVGKGKVIAFSDNPNFRAFWYGTNRLFLNALFFGSTIESETIK